jgi:feruloyl-CoA synthase
MTQDHGKISAILDMLAPALVYAADARVYGRAVQAWGASCPVVFGQHAHELAGARSFAALAEAAESPAVAAAFAAVRPQDHAKYLLTSGSTEQPKVVINTHACSAPTSR